MTTADREPEASRLRVWMTPETRSRRILIGLAIYVACVVVFALLAGDRLAVHTPYNHYALMADAWLHGRHDLAAGPPAYAGGNDFALFDGKWFISFPPFPAILMLPLVAASGSPENFRDGQFIVWLAGIGPAVLFLVFEKLRRTGRSLRTEIDNVRLALLFAFGTVFFFTAVQGTVWFAAHVVGIALAALFVLFALDAERPVLAGVMLGAMFLTRPTTAFVGVFLLAEALRVAHTKKTDASDTSDASDTGDASEEPDVVDRIRAFWNGVDKPALYRVLVRCAVPVGVALAFASWLNWSRFHDPSPSAFGHEYLQVGWKTRIDRWGLFSVHFLPRNLAVMLGSLPWRPLPSEPKVAVQLLGMTLRIPHFMISGHGLALWFTTPIYFWLGRPSGDDETRQKRTFVWIAAALAALGPLLMNLLYQNSGWFQFGYRFSNDYAVFLFVMLAVGVRKMGRVFWIAAAWAIAWNLFGAMSFERQAFGPFYSHEAAVPMQRYRGPSTLDLVYPPD